MRCFLLLLVTIFTIASLPIASVAQWQNEFAAVAPASATDGEVTDLHVHGGDLYVSGGFTQIDGLPVNGIARWNGTSWSDVGLPLFADRAETHIVGPLLWDISEYQGDLIVGGNFTTVNGQPGNVGVWNGTSWSAIDVTLDKAIYSLQGIGSDLYVGSESHSDMVVRWNGTSTQALTSQVFGGGGAFVRDISVHNGDPVFVGNFYRIDLLDVNYVAGYGFPGGWYAFDQGVTGIAMSTFTHNGDLYVQMNNDILKWANGAWSSATTVAAGCQSSAWGTWDAGFFLGDLYRTGGSEEFITSRPMYGIMKWSGIEWDNMGGGIASAMCYTSPPYRSTALAEYNGKLIVGGEFVTVGGVDVQNLAAWDGAAWLTRSPDGRVRAVATNGVDVFAGGDFTTAHGQSMSHVARWDGANWQPLAGGVNGDVHDMLVLGGDLYVAGSFTDASGSGAKYVAKWDGANWSALTGFDGGHVYALATDGANLYAGGEFVNFIPPSTLIQRIGKWDGSQWSTLGAGINDGTVYALEWDGANLYAGGDFTKADNVITGNTVRWNGSNWLGLGLGFNNRVNDLEMHDGVLYAGGIFTLSTGPSNPMNNVARWNGSEWEALDTGANNGTDAGVLGLRSTGFGLVAVGNFSNAGTTAANRIAVWDGVQWSAFDNGLDAPADDAAVIGGDLFVGGQFVHANDMSALYFAHWVQAPTGIDDDTPAVRATMLEPPHPNPFNPSTTIRYTVAAAGAVSIAIYDVRGRLVRTLVQDEHADAGPHVTVWNGEDARGNLVASGVYYVRMLTHRASQTQKVVLLK